MDMIDASPPRMNIATSLCRPSQLFNAETISFGVLMGVNMPIKSPKKHIPSLNRNGIQWV